MTAFILCKEVSLAGSVLWLRGFRQYPVLGTGLDVSVSPQGEESTLKGAQRSEPFTDRAQPGAVLKVCVAKAAWSLFSSGVESCK